MIFFLFKNCILFQIQSQFFIVFMYSLSQTQRIRRIRAKQQSILDLEE